MDAQLNTSWSGGLGQFGTSWLDNSDTIGLVADIDTGNVDASLSSVADAATTTPTLFLVARSGSLTGGGWRHMLFAVTNAGGRTPIFKLDKANIGISPSSEWKPVYTQDFVTWTYATTVVISAPDGTIEFQFDGGMPSGTVYIATSPIGTQAMAGSFASELLGYEGCDPTVSANASGVFNTSPVEVDENGRNIGENSMYALKLSWPDPTTDGYRKRKLVAFAGIHAAGEAFSFLAFMASLRWALNDTSLEAQSLRANWDIYVYFNLTPNGLYGGNRRTNFRVSTDPNRSFGFDDTSDLQEIQSTIDAAKADTGGSCDCFFSWHSYSSRTDPFIPGCAPDRNQQTDDFIAIANTVFGTSASAYTSTAGGVDYKWATSSLSAVTAFDTECPQSGSTQVSFIEGIGEKWFISLSEADAAGIYDANLGTATPVASFTVNNSTPTLGQTVTATDTSTDADSDSLSLSWSLSIPAGSGIGATSGIGSTFGFTPDVEGSYTLQLTADDGTATDTAQQTITTAGAVDTTAPSVTGFSTASTSASLTLTIDTFTASDDTGVTGYLITESSSQPAAGDSGWSGSPPTEYVASGEGSVTLYPWAKDAAGNVSSVYGSPATVTITLPAGNTAPVAGFSLNNPSPLVGQTVTATDTSTDADSDTLTRSWALTPPAGSAIATLSGSAGTFSFTPDVAGAYTLALTVNDGTTTDSSQQTVTAAAELAVSDSLSAVRNTKILSTDATASVTACEIEETSYEGYDNRIDLTLQDDRHGDMANSNLSSVSRMKLVGGGISIDSEISPEVFDWSTGNGLLTLSLGDVLSAGIYVLYLAVMDTHNPDGVVWETALNIESIKLS
ncbi:MAG: hypothetical protein RBR43_10100 [Desulfuromonadaceae bacterium]|nr:hypothetical protein [Desulfuromonadaceae bacterium]